MKVQAATPKKLERLIRGVSLSKLRKRPAPDKWSPLPDCDLPRSVTKGRGSVVVESHPERPHQHAENAKNQLEA